MRKKQWKEDGDFRFEIRENQTEANSQKSLKFNANPAIAENWKSLSQFVEIYSRLILPTTQISRA